MNKMTKNELKIKELITAIRNVKITEKQFKIHFPMNEYNELSSISEDYISDAINETYNNAETDLYNYYTWLSHEFPDEHSCDVSWEILFMK